MMIIDDTHLWVSVSREHQRATDGRLRFSEWKAKKLRELAKLIEFENSFYMPREAIMKALHIQDGPKNKSNLRRWLRSIEDLIEVETSRHGLPTGYFKITVNPAYIWVENEFNTKTRDKAVDEWYMDKSLSLLSKTDIVACNLGEYLEYIET